jgi:hypothetical protein
MSFGTTFIFNTLNKGQRISNKNWNSDPSFEFERKLIEFLEFDSIP